MAHMQPLLLKTAVSFIEMSQGKKAALVIGGAVALVTGLWIKLYFAGKK